MQQPMRPRRGKSHRFSPEPTCWFGRADDMRAVRRMLRHGDPSDRRAASVALLSLFTSSVGHDFKNILAALLGHLELAQLELPERSPAAQVLARAGRAARYGTLLTQTIVLMAQERVALQDPGVRQLAPLELYAHADRFGYSMAHIIGDILDKVREAQRLCEGDEPVTETLAQVELAAQRGCAILTTVLQLMRQEPPPRTPSSLNN